MTRDELDTLWSRAMHEAIKAGEDFTRYHFAALLRERMIADGWRQCAQGQKTTQHCAVAEQARQDERARACRIVTGLCLSDNNSHEINEAIRGEE